MITVKEDEVIDMYEANVGGLKAHYYKHKLKYIFIGGVLAGSALTYIAINPTYSNGLIRPLVAINSPVTNHIIHLVSQSELGDSTNTLHTLDSQ